MQFGTWKVPETQTQPEEPRCAYCYEAHVCEATPDGTLQHGPLKTIASRGSPASRIHRKIVDENMLWLNNRRQRDIQGWRIARPGMSEDIARKSPSQLRHETEFSPGRKPTGQRFDRFMVFRWIGRDLQSENGRQICQPHRPNLQFRHGF